MAERRMFAKTIIDSDAFLDMPLSSQALYFHLSMRADDEGFINNPRKISRMIGASDDDMRVLIAKNFIIPFESGVVVIKHWKIHNYIQKDRFKATVYKEEKSLLDTKDNGSYTLDTGCIQDGYSLETQVRLGKDSIGKDRIGKESVGEVNTEARLKYPNGEFGHVYLTNDEMIKLQEEYGVEKTDEAIIYLDEYIEMKGTKYTSHYLALKKWVFNALKERESKKTSDGQKEIPKGDNIFLQMAQEEGLI